MPLELANWPGGANEAKLSQVMVAGGSRATNLLRLMAANQQGFHAGCSGIPVEVS